ncbi:MAG: DUF2147 domain-containing protein [Beijerinckiaceae bacterium]
MKVFRLAAVAFVLAAAPALAADGIVGTWERSDGTSRIRMSPCGGGFCGVVSWLRDPANSPSKVGQRVFYDMKADGSGWSGSAFNPEDGKTYTGKATVSGSSMTTQGCVLGGLICKSVNWSRVN